MGKCHDVPTAEKHSGTDYPGKLWNCHPQSFLRASEENLYQNGECQKADTGCTALSALYSAAGLQILTEMTAGLLST